MHEREIVHMHYMHNLSSIINHAKIELLHDKKTKDA